MAVAPGRAAHRTLRQRRRSHPREPGRGTRRPARLRGRVELVVLLAAKLDHERGPAAIGLDVPRVAHEQLAVEDVLRVRQLQHEQAARAQRGAARGQRGRRGVVAQRVCERAQRQERHVRGRAALRAAPAWAVAALVGLRDGPKCEALSLRSGSDFA
jgi:hypothetical protein